MQKFLFALALSLSMEIAYSQTEKFDIASFIPPQGWQRLDSNGKVGFFDSKSVNGGAHFCQILLYPSRASSGNATKDFTEEWNKRIVKLTGYSKKPGMQTKISPDGWTVVTGYANIPIQGNVFTCSLTSYSGFGKTMAILANLAGQEYLPVIDQFYKSVVMDKNAVVKKNSTSSSTNNTTTPGTLADYTFIPPQGWTVQQYPDGIVIGSPVSNTGEKCNITCWPMRPTSGNLQTDASNLFAQVFKEFDLKAGSTASSMVRGISLQGWEYFMVKRGIALRGGDFQTMFGFAFVARLGNQVAALSGISKDPLVSSCFGLMMTDVWPKFFYSLQFKNWQSSVDQTAIVNHLAGVWMAVTATAGDRFVFASNGRFAGAAASQRYVRLSSTELLSVTDAYFGDGSYKISGNTIWLMHDGNKNNPETALFRIEQQSMDEGRTWTEKLFLLRKSAVDGSEYEVGYDKQ